jgi:hypothetical protein
MRRRRQFGPVGVRAPLWRWLAGGGVVAAALLAGFSSPACGDPFRADFETLTRAQHRLSGTEELRAAADYVEQRLRAIGVGDVFRLEMPLWQTRVERCELRVEGRTVSLLPLRPNVVVPPATPAEGLTGPLVYAGRGEHAAYGERSAQGAIVVLEYDSGENWQRAFAMGAQAVVFVGDDTATPVAPKHTGVPVNLVRLYAPPSALEQFDLRRDHPQATVVSHVRWEPGTGVNVVAMLRGADPVIAGAHGRPEALVLAAHLDSFGIVPEASSGARSAANVAALLEVAAHFQAHRPRRDVVLMFLDNQARYHQGARAVYAALAMSEREHEDLTREHRVELEFVEQLIAALTPERPPLTGPGPVVSAAIETMKRQAEARSADLKVELLGIRLAVRDADSEPQRAALQQQRQHLEEIFLAWEDSRRHLHRHALTEIAPDIYAELRAATMSRFEQRWRELQQLSRINEQRHRLRAALADRWVALHVTLNLSDGAPTWGVVVGDSTHLGFAAGVATRDQPGYYGRVLRAVREAADSLPQTDGLERGTLQDPTLGRQFAPDRFVASGAIAGSYGIYNVSLMTLFDGRWRDGHPADTPQRLDAAALRRQARAATPLLGALADGEALSLPRTFSNLAQTVWPRWQAGRSSGNYAGLMTTGSVAEDRPATGALMALWPATPARIWEPHAPVRFGLPAFERLALETVDAHGRFKLEGLRRDLFHQFVTLGAMFDAQGELAAISNRETLVTTPAGVITRVNLIPARAHAAMFPLIVEPDATPFRVLDAATNAELLSTRSLFGHLDGIAFFHTFAFAPIERVKLFQPKGPALLGVTPEQLHGAGYPLQMFRTPPAVDRHSAEDLWRLNEGRLGILRAHGVNQVDLETLHGRARRTLAQAHELDAVEPQQAALAQSALLSRRVSPVLREAMNDLVHAIVMLLLLNIPFAFAMERLLFCATGIYTRLAGFAGIFLVSFTLLFLMHPGFAIAATPLIIFLAFSIILLSSLVIYIVARKFKTELKEYQGQSTRLHSLEVSRLGTLIAAVNMGMSTMRRRPTRTTLTALTVLILTFTVLCFASLSTQRGVRAVYEGPATEETPAGVMTRQLDYSPLPARLPDLLRGREGRDGLLAGQWWLARQTLEDAPSSIARLDDGRALWLDAVMGIDPRELQRWPQLAETLRGETDSTGQQALARGGVFLPAFVRDRLELRPGDAVALNGRRAVFAGTLDGGALQRLKHLDGRSVIPVDFQAAGITPLAAPLEIEPAEDLAQRDFVRLSPDQVAVVSAELARELRGQLHIVTVYPAAGIDAPTEGRRIAEIVSLPVWARGAEGVERLIFTRLTEVRGGWGLLVPVALGGLIIFGTLLGSITDREREIYTFSALGLAPAHVGFLFFAEAAVYAVVGGMGGQLLAQAVAVLAGNLAAMGLIQAPAINYSSTNALFANAVVMATVMISAAYPAWRASRSANPGVQRAWKMPPPEADRLHMTFPFTVSAYDITGVISFLAEHFREHDDAGLGAFAAQRVGIGRDPQTGHLMLEAELALAPFDLGVTQSFRLSAAPSDIAGVDEVIIEARRRSGAREDWVRSNRVFLHDLRRQFLLWRTLSTELIEEYRRRTLETLGEQAAAGAAGDTAGPGRHAEVLG